MIGLRISPFCIDQSYDKLKVYVFFVLVQSVSKVLDNLVHFSFVLYTFTFR